jgi:hypothetical protein
MLPASPTDGDIVVREDLREGLHVYLVLNASGRDQLLVRSRDAAVQLAVRVAARERVSAWLIDRDGFILLENFRTVESV